MNVRITRPRNSRGATLILAEGYMRKYLSIIAILAASLASVGTCRADNKGFVKVFDGKSLDGWRLIGGVGPGYVPQNGILVCPKDGGGNLVTDKEYGDFVFRFDFRLHHGSNNGIG